MRIKISTTVGMVMINFLKFKKSSQFVILEELLPKLVEPHKPFNKQIKTIKIIKMAKTKQTSSVLHIATHTKQRSKKHVQIAGTK